MAKKHTKAYAAILKESRARKMPNGHTDDLTVYDRARLDSSEPPESFGWVLRKSGTLLLDAAMSNDNRAGYIGHITKSGRCDSDRCYFWDGKQLASMTAIEMGKRMAPHATVEANRSRY